MDTEDIEKDEANTAEAEDESPGVIDEEMDAKEDGEEEHVAEEERTEGMDRRAVRNKMRERVSR